MSIIFESRLFSRTFAIDEISKRPQARQLRFKRAFQFLQLLLIQRVYTLTAIACSTQRRLSKQQNGRDDEQYENFEVFLGGSCNPTTWRHDQAIPYFSSRSVSYYNPQVANWTPDLVEIEHHAKEVAPLLFFVIDRDTRALASMVEVCYLAACGRNIIVVMTPIPEINSTKFIQQKSENYNLENNQNDYENACEVRRVTQQLLRSLHIPVFENIDSALECAAYILETTKRSVIQNSDKAHCDSEATDVITPLPSSPSEFKPTPSSSVVYIRSLSNKTSFDDPQDFYQQFRTTQSTNSSSTSPNLTRKRNFLSVGEHMRPTTNSTKPQFSCSTQESDDDGYGSLRSSNREMSLSNSSLHSDSFEPCGEHIHDQDSKIPRGFKVNEWISRWYSYVPFVGTVSSIVGQSISAIFTTPSRFLGRHRSPSAAPTTSETSDDRGSDYVSESLQSSPPSSPSPSPLPLFLFDVYIAGGNRDQPWITEYALEKMRQKEIRYVQRQSYFDGDQADITYDKHLRTKSQVLLYLINGEERLSDLTAELAYLIGEQKQKIVVYLEPKMSQTESLVLAPCERRDLDRSRSYLLDLINKEKIKLADSLENSLQLVFQLLDEANGV